ncbi:ABC transporter substrate-binding protein [Leucobacter sp. CSA2]|uniref:ABC transporter substrate-binding protein n=1 Tax=Leucobacter edaphi TaxID=2796472 RepID=A0A934UWE0_9MICO|nr:ABC transporter substrate-binding protein [Leucobacter edaphi]MBK0421579.1 ABC transporter substrate-binding protein [Leucobacter edaphi]
MHHARTHTRKHTLAVTAILAAGALLLAGCSDPTTQKGGDSSSSSPDGKDPIIVSSANFTTSEIVANLYAESLRDAGIPVETKFNVGSREAYVPALKDGSIDLIPDFTGNLLLFLNKDADMSSREKIDTQLATALQADGLEMLEPAPAEDKDALVVTEERAKQWKLQSIADLKAHNDELKIAGAPEFKQRPVGLPGLEKNYGVVPKEFVSISDGGGPATVKALVNGDVQAANIYTASSSIPANKFVVLEDPKFNFPSQNTVPVISEKKVTDQVKKVLNGVSAKLTTEELVKLDEMVTGPQKLEPNAAAKQWLKEKGLI